MTYEQMFEAIRDNHSEHWGGTFAEMMESDKKLTALSKAYPELYAKAQEDFNNYLRTL